MIKKLYKKHRDTTHNFFWRSLQIFSKYGVAAAIFFIAAKLLEPEDFGLLNYLRAAVALLMIVCDFGLSHATFKFAAEYETLKSEKLNKLLFSVTALIVVIAAIISIATICFGQKIFKENYRYILLFLPYLFLMPLTSVIDGLYRGLKQFRKLALISSIVGVFSLFISFALISRFYLVGAILAQNTMYLLLALSLYAFQKKFTFEFDKSVITDVFKYALVIGIGLLAHFLYSRIDILILKQFGFLVEIGYYGIINYILWMLFIPFAILGQVIAPNTTKHITIGNFAEIKSKLKKYAVLCGTAGLALSVLLFFGLPIILKAVLPEYYTAGFVLIINIMLLLLPFKVWGAVLSQGFVFPAGYAKIATVVVLIGGVLNVILDYVFISIFGFVGVFWVTLMVHSMSILITTIYFYMKLNTKSSIEKLKETDTTQIAQNLQEKDFDAEL